MAARGAGRGPARGPARGPVQSRAADAAGLDEVARAGAADAGGLPIDLLGGFLPAVVAAVKQGAPIPPRSLRAYRNLGARAAREGVPLRALLDLYLSSAWRLWRLLPPVAAARDDPDAAVIAGEVMLHAVDDVVAVLTEGYQLARRTLIREQESARQEFIDDLLAGSADVPAVLGRAAGFGLDLAGPHAVAVVAATRPFDHAGPLLGSLERAVQGAKGDAHALLGSKDQRLVMVFAAPDRAATAHVAEQIAGVLRRESANRDGAANRDDAHGDAAHADGAWRIALSRARSGADGVAASYREAVEALALADRLGLPARILDASDLLAYRVLLRDRAALDDLIIATLGPLRSARGGAGPLVRTLAAYFDAGGNTAETARRLHLSVRAVTYRLERIAQLTGRDPASAQDRFALHAAVLGATLTGWADSL